MGNTILNKVAVGAAALALGAALSAPVLAHAEAASFQLTDKAVTARVDAGFDGSRMAAVSGTVTTTTTGGNVLPEGDMYLVLVSSPILDAAGGNPIVPALNMVIGKTYKVGSIVKTSGGRVFHYIPVMGGWIEVTNLNVQLVCGLYPNCK